MSNYKYFYLVRLREDSFFELCVFSQHTLIYLLSNLFILLYVDLELDGWERCFGYFIVSQGHYDLQNWKTHNDLISLEAKAINLVHCK